jgi:hypothetical protein
MYVISLISLMVLEMNRELFRMAGILELTNQSVVQRARVGMYLQIVYEALFVSHHLQNIFDRAKLGLRPINVKQRKSACK